MPSVVHQQIKESSKLKRKTNKKRKEERLNISSPVKNDDFKYKQQISFCNLIVNYIKFVETDIHKSLQVRFFKIEAKGETTFLSKKITI